MELINLFLPLLINLFVDEIFASGDKNLAYRNNILPVKPNRNEAYSEVRLINNPHCKDSFSRLCSSLSQISDDLTVLECIQSYKVCILKLIHL